MLVNTITPHQHSKRNHKQKVIKIVVVEGVKGDMIEVVIKIKINMKKVKMEEEVEVAMAEAGPGAPYLYRHDPRRV